MTAVIGDVWYRFNGFPGYNGETTVGLDELKVIKLTPRGVRIERWLHDDIGRFVLNVDQHTRKSFAYPSKEQAWESFKIRTARRLSYAEAKVEFCKKLSDGIVGLNADCCDRLVEPGHWRSVMKEIVVD